VRGRLSAAVPLVLAWAAAAPAVAQQRGREMHDMRAFHDQVVALAAAQPAAPPVSAARLQGSFLLGATVTVAANVPGERVGQTFTRTWTFSSGCPTGPCQTVSLTRPRASGVDQLTLHLRGPGHYAGFGSFYAPLRCAGRTYPRGARVPFKISVQVTLAALAADGSVIAKRIAATYVNRRRINRTPCVAVLGHDAARYHGYLVTQSPAGS
jgi:hypothetical protein